MTKQSIILASAIILLLGRVGLAGTLWLGNDTGGPVYHTGTDGTLLGSVVTPVTGIAFDGSSLYFSNATGGTTRRTLDGGTVLDTFLAPAFGNPTEDLAWDSTRNRLWRIDHASPFLVRINPVSGMVDQTIALSPIDPGGLLTSLGGLGIAYDPTRDLLYASFCQQGCASFGAGLIMSFSPVNGAFAGLQLRPGFATGGLGFDPLTDTLWVGAGQVIHNIDLNGADLSSFTKPGGAGFTDGLEFVPSVPEPVTSGLLLSAVLFLVFRDRRTIGN